MRKRTLMAAMLVLAISSLTVLAQGREAMKQTGIESVVLLSLGGYFLLRRKPTLTQ